MAWLPADLEFAHPVWLQGLWSLPLLILLYLWRRRASRVAVAFLPLWERVFARRDRRQHWWHTVLSLLLQMAALSASVVLMAGPQRVQSVAMPAHTIILVDRSLGTGMLDRGTPLSSAVTARALEVLDQAAARGTVAVAALTDGVVPLTGAEATIDQARAAIRGEIRAQGSRDWGLVADAMRDLPVGTRCVVVTPFQPTWAAGAPAGVTIQSASPQPLPANGGIRGVERADAGAGLVVTVDTGGLARELRWNDDAGHVAITAVAAEPRRQTLAVAAPAIGAAAAPAGPGTRPTLTLEPADAFAADDRVELPSTRPAGLAVVVAAVGPTPWLDAALVASGVVDAARSGRTTRALLARAAPAFDVGIVVGVADAAEAPALGPGRWILFDAVAADVPIERGAGLGTGHATVVHPGATWCDALDPAEWTLVQAPSWREAVGATARLNVLVDGSRGPLLARYRARALDAVFFGVIPDPAASTLPLLPAFPLMLRGALMALAPPRDVVATAVEQAGGRVLLTRAEAAAFASADGGGAVPLAPMPDGGGWRLPATTGRWTAGNRALTTAWLSHPGLPVMAAATDDPWPDPPRRPDVISLRGPLLLALLAVLLLEWWLYHTGISH